MNRNRLNNPFLIQKKDAAMGNPNISAKLLILLVSNT